MCSHMLVWVYVCALLAAFLVNSSVQAFHTHMEILSVAIGEELLQGSPSRGDYIHPSLVSVCLSHPQTSGVETPFPSRGIYLLI